ncbi:MAG: 4'-phosphopantetheinyl transferase superfamily protein [Reyranella sp.]|nr:4'-phosphopantetheinyl transferase superfamily protein [Reyranella sp.]
MTETETRALPTTLPPPTDAARSAMAMPLFAPLLPDWVHVSEMDPAMADSATLLPEERTFVAVAVGRRRREFAAGRSLARSLLASLGKEAPLCREADGRPAWPPGIVGSITHCTTLAAVALASTDDCAGIGIDVEANRPLPQGVARLILSEQEQRWIRRSDPRLAAETLLRVFCAKEALYKAIYPLARCALPPQALIVERSARNDSFVARLAVEGTPFPKDMLLEGRWAARRGHVAAAVVIKLA